MARSGGVSTPWICDAAARPRTRSTSRRSERYAACHSGAPRRDLSRCTQIPPPGSSRRGKADAPPPPPDQGRKVKFIPYDKAPTPMSPIRPEYPEIAMEAGIEGTVIVQAFINKKGVVEDTMILKGIPNTGLNEAAEEAVKRTRWKPARQRDKKVGVWMSIPINFKLTTN